MSEREMSEQDTQHSLGKLIDEKSQRDAIHIAVAPVVATERLSPGQRIGLVGDSNTEVRASATGQGIVDPFLPVPVVKGDRFWMWLIPNTITSLRHQWTHPAFNAQEQRSKSASEKWMREWAMQHMSGDYCGDGDTVSIGEDAAYEYALRAGHELCVGPFEDARDHIDNEWWAHWEAITGKTGQRGEYFSCSC